MLAKWQLSDSLFIDEARLSDSHEAWVYVIVHRDEGPQQFEKVVVHGPGGQDNLRLFHGFGPYPRAGVLTWGNTD